MFVSNEKEMILRIIDNFIETAYYPMDRREYFLFDAVVQVGAKNWEGAIREADRQLFYINELTGYEFIKADEIENVPELYDVYYMVIIPERTENGAMMKLNDLVEKYNIDLETISMPMRLY